MSNEPTNDPGYVIIDTPEKRQQYAPKLATDEVWSGYSWIPVTNDHEFWSSSHPYRRKLPQAADDQQYRKAFEKWKKLGLSSEAHWLPRTKDSKCELPFWLGRRGKAVLITSIPQGVLHDDCTHYIPIQSPEPPRAETAEEAFEKWLASEMTKAAPFTIRDWQEQTLEVVMLLSKTVGTLTVIDWFYSKDMHPNTQNAIKETRKNADELLNKLTHPVIVPPPPQPKPETSEEACKRIFYQQVEDYDTELQDKHKYSFTQGFNAALAWQKGQTK